MTEAAALVRPRNAVPLPANSFDFKDTGEAIDAALDHDDETKRHGALAAAVRSSALLADVLTEQEKPMAPDGSELKSVMSQGGQTVLAPVGIPAVGAESGEEAAARDPNAPHVKMSIARLTEIAAKRGVDVSGAQNNAERVALIEAGPAKPDAADQVGSQAGAGAAAE